jgi:hypothetical protein
VEFRIHGEGGYVQSGLSERMKSAKLPNAKRRPLKEDFELETNSLLRNVFDM